jgi:hypothetical protein
LNHFRNHGEVSKKFTHYCIYAFGLPIAIVIIVVILNEASLIPECWKTGIGKHSCSVSDPLFDRSDEAMAHSQRAQSIYLYGPIALFLTVNVVLYAATFVKINREKKRAGSDEQLNRLITEREMPR